MSEVPRHQDWVGWIAIAVTIALWVAFALSTRAIAFSELTPLDVAAIRYTVPALLLLPWLGRTMDQVRRAPTWSIACVVIGAGLPFFMLSALGGSLSSATYVGVINPGMPPVYVAILGFVLWRRRVTPVGIVGYVAIVLGVTALVAAAPAHIGLSAALLLLLAALFWAFYTVGLQRADLHPLSTIVLVCLPSAIVADTLILTGLGASHFVDASLAQIGAFTLVQGIGSGVISSIAYVVAIRRLGAPVAASCGAASPVIVAILAVPVFGETVGLVAAMGILLVVAGIVTVNLGNRSRQANQRMVASESRALPAGSPVQTLPTDG